MKEIRHSFLIRSAPETITAALLHDEHIRRWWTADAKVQHGRGIFEWSGYGWTVELDMTFDQTRQAVVWNCTKSNMQNTHAWEGTAITFTLTPEKGGIRLDFAQTGYRESPCYDACHQGWAFFIGTSLKLYLESGKGVPYPEIQDTRLNLERTTS